MEHATFQQVIAQLDDEDRRDLLAPSNSAGLVHLAKHVAVLCVSAIWIMQGLPFWPVALLIYAVAFIFLFTLLHETVHDTPFASPWINRTVGAICGFLLLLPARWFEFFHLAHHRHTQDENHDPELAEPKPRTWIGYVCYLSGLPVWGSQLESLFGNALGTRHDSFVPPKRRRSVVTEARVHLTLYAILAAICLHPGWPALIWLWVIPALLGQPFLRAYLLAEHARCPFVADMLENSRTTYTNRLIRFIAWNMPYHAEHHAYPAVPFHRLPQLNALIRDQLKVTENGYFSFHRKFAGTLE